MKIANLIYDKNNYDNRKLSVQPELLIVFLQSKMTHVGRLWLSLKFLDYQAAGILSLNYVKSILCNKDNDYYLMSSGNLLKLLHRFNGEFWQFSNDRIVIYSPSRIANYFELDKFGYNSIWFYPEQIFSGLAMFNAACYAGYITTLGNMPTSRETIYRDTYVTKSSQIRYEQLTGIEINANVVLTDWFFRPKDKEELRRNELGDSLTEVNINGRKLLSKRIGNSFDYSRMVKKSGGRNRRRLNKAIKSVFIGKRNKSLSDYDSHLPGLEPTVVDNLGNKMIRQFEGVIKSVVKFKEVLRKDFTVKRFAILEDQSCYVFTPM